jgi:DNA-binding HxlR family transcriptional regulator
MAGGHSRSATEQRHQKDANVRLSSRKVTPRCNDNALMNSADDVPRFEHARDFLAEISERWTYPILREIFFGVSRFGTLKRALRIAPNILTDRLQRLVDLGLVTKTQYREDKDWFDYQLSADARDLIMPAIILMTRWAEARETPGGHRRALFHTSCGHQTDPYLVCSHCRQPVDAANLKPLSQTVGETGDNGEPTRV